MIVIDDTLIEKRKKEVGLSHVGLIDIIRRLIRTGFFVSRGRIRYSGTKWIMKI